MSAEREAMAAQSEQAEPRGKEEQADTVELMRLLEALLFAAPQPLSVAVLQKALPPQHKAPIKAVKAALAQLEQFYRRRGVNLLRRNEAYAFRTAADLQYVFSDAEKQVKKLSRAAREVLAVIAYHQPLSRAELEDIRGVETAKGTLDILLETGWVRIAGRRDAPGRPTTYGTSTAFLDYFNLNTLEDLPGLEELRGAGLLSRAPPENPAENEQNDR